MGQESSPSGASAEPAAPDRKARGLEALCETVRSLGMRRDLDTLLDDILKEAQELIGFDHCALLLYLPGSAELQFTRVRGFDERRDEIEGLRVPLDRGLSGWAARHREPVRVGDVKNDPRYVPGLRDCVSNLAVPLVIQGELVGVLNVESRRPDAFEPFHERLLTILGTQAALAIVASRATAGLQDRMRQLRALYRISSLTWADKSLDQVIDTVLEEVSRLAPAGSCALLLRDEEEDCLVIRGAEGYGDDVVGKRIPLGHGVCGRCYETGQRQHVQDVGSDPDYIPGVPHATSEVAIPLIVDDEVIGVLNSEAAVLGGFDDDHVRTLTLIARQVASVLNTARLQDERLRQAITDPLTGVYNRRYFEERLDVTLERARRYDEAVAVMLLDLDRFKEVNDNRGHSAGDEVLRRVAEAVRTSIRSSDLLARMGGDEYAVLMLEASGAQAVELAERLRRRLEALTVSCEGHEVAVTCSIGVACFGDSEATARDLMRHADEALYEAKRAGRNRVQMASACGEGAEE